jgi:hypothetical protein
LSLIDIFEKDWKLYSTEADLQVCLGRHAGYPKIRGRGE